MCKRLFVSGFVAVAFLLMGVPLRATCDPQTGVDPVSITCHYTPSVTSNTFSYSDGNSLDVGFSAVLVDFDLTVTERFLSTADFAGRLDSRVFPEGSTCYEYVSHPFGRPCAVYDATSSPSPLIKGTHYRGPVRWFLRYLSRDTSGEPAFCHGPGTSTQCTQNILQFYSVFPVVPSEGDDPSMQGDSGGLSIVAAVKKPAGNNCFSWVSPGVNQPFKVGAEVEVAFRLFPGSSCTGTPIRDKDARLSVARIVGGQPVFVPLETGGNHFHFNNKDKVNEHEFETEELPPGEYVITVFSDEFGTRSRTIFLN